MKYQNQNKLNKKAKRSADQQKKWKQIKKNNFKKSKGAIYNQRENEKKNTQFMKDFEQVHPNADHDINKVL